MLYEKVSVEKGTCMNARILLGLTTVGVTLALVTGSAFALFTSQATTTGNTFSTATAALKIAKDISGTEGTPAASITGFSPTAPIVPGYQEDFKFWLENQSTNQLGLSNTAQFANPGTSDSALLSGLQVTISCKNTTTNATVSAGPFSVSQWISTPASIGSLAAAQKASCSMHVALPSDAASTLQGKTVTFDGQFIGTQQ